MRGLLALNLAVADPKLNAAVSYYGNAPKKGIDKINAAILMNYASDDPKRTKSVKPFAAALKKIPPRVLPCCRAGLFWLWSGGSSAARPPARQLV